MAVWMVFLLLCMISIIEVYSASSTMSYKSGNFWMPVVWHGSYVLLGVAFAWVVHRIPCRFFKPGCAGLLFLSYLMLVYVLFATRINGAARWIELGPITIQPSEFAKLSLVGFVAFIAAEAREGGHINKIGMQLIGFAAGLAVLLILFENGSTAVLLSCVIFFMLCFAKAPNKFLAPILVAGVSTVILAGLLMATLSEERLAKMADHPILHRVPTWVHRVKGYEKPENPQDYNLTDNVQVTHARIAIATSYGIGKGPGNSVQRDYLPQAYSDFIYAIIIEEWGVFGAFFVMGLYLLLMWRALRIASKCSHLFPAYLVMGLALMMMMQAMMNMAVAVGAMPVTGQPLPLISKGGTSTFINCAYIGMILSVSWSAKKKEEELQPALIETNVQ